MSLKTGWIVLALMALPFAVPAESVHLKNGKSLQGRILSREADRIWLETDAGRVPIPLDRIAVPTPGMLSDSRAAYEAGEHRRALKLGQIILFWEPGNQEAADLVKRSEYQITLAHRGQELTDRDGEAERVYEELNERLGAVGDPDADPAGAEAELLLIESELRTASVDFADTSLSERFNALLEETSERALAAHERRVQAEARAEIERTLEIQRKRAEALGIRDFLAPVATLNNGGKPLDIETLMVPGGIMVFDFYADWCAPCRELDPHLRSLAKSQENVYLRRINMLDWDTPIARQYDLKSIPSIWVYDAEGNLVESNLNGLENVREAVLRAGGE